MAQTTEPSSAAIKYMKCTCCAYHQTKYEIRTLYCIPKSIRFMNKHQHDCDCDCRSKFRNHFRDNVENCMDDLLNRYKYFNKKFTHMRFCRTIRTRSRLLHGWQLPGEYLTIREGEKLSNIKKLFLFMRDFPGLKIFIGLKIILFTV
jgi:hypothetical protein